MCGEYGRAGARNAHRQPAPHENDERCRYLSSCERYVREIARNTCCSACDCLARTPMSQYESRRSPLTEVNRDLSSVGLRVDEAKRLACGAAGEEGVGERPCFGTPRSSSHESDGGQHCEETLLSVRENIMNLVAEKDALKRDVRNARVCSPLLPVVRPSALIMMHQRRR
jgi:hypothetical protein